MNVPHDVQNHACEVQGDEGRPDLESPLLLDLGSFQFPGILYVALLHGVVCFNVLCFPGRGVPCRRHSQVALTARLDRAREGCARRAFKVGTFCGPFLTCSLAAGCGSDRTSDILWFSPHSLDVPIGRTVLTDSRPGYHVWPAHSPVGFRGGVFWGGWDCGLAYIAVDTRGQVASVRLRDRDAGGGVECGSPASIPDGDGIIALLPDESGLKWLRIGPELAASEAEGVDLGGEAAVRVAAGRSDSQIVVVVRTTADTRLYADVSFEESAWGLGERLFASESQLFDPSFGDLYVADMDGDGQLEVPSWGFFEQRGNYAELDLSFVKTNSGPRFALADVESDGDLDVVDLGDAVVVVNENRDGTFVRGAECRVGHEAGVLAFGGSLHVYTSGPRLARWSMCREEETGGGLPRGTAEVVVSPLGAPDPTVVVHVVSDG